MGVEKGEEIQTKGIHNLFNRIIENFPKGRKEKFLFKKERVTQVQEAYRTPNRQDQKRTS
jgi:hypothetical protein